MVFVIELLRGLSKVWNFLRPLSQLFLLQLWPGLCSWKRPPLKAWPRLGMRYACYLVSAIIVKQSLGIQIRGAQREAIVGLLGLFQCALS